MGMSRAIEGEGLRIWLARWQGEGLPKFLSIIEGEAEAMLEVGLSNFSSKARRLLKALIWLARRAQP